MNEDLQVLTLAEIRGLRADLAAFHEQWARCNGTRRMPALGPLKNVIDEVPMSQAEAEARGLAP